MSSAGAQDAVGPYEVVEKYLPSMMGEPGRFVGFVVVDARGSEVAGPTRQRAARQIATRLNASDTLDRRGPAS